MKKTLLTLGLLLSAFPLFGQATTGYHRVNQVIARSSTGVFAQVVPFAQVSVTNTATGNAATIYSDPLLSSPIASSLVTADLSGNYSYYMPLNTCNTESISSPGQGAIVIPNICGNPASTVLLQTNGTNNGLQTLLNLVAGTGIVLTNTGGAVTINAQAGSGVTSINTVTGDFTFGGSGVSCVGTTCTFSGGGGSGITTLTGDGTAGPGTGSQAFTLATVNSSPGSCGDATHVCQITTNGKGLTTSQTAVAITSTGGFPITLGSTSIAANSTTTSIAGLTVNGVTLNATGSTSLFLNQAGGYTASGGTPASPSLSAQYNNSGVFGALPCITDTSASVFNCNFGNTLGGGNTYAPMTANCARSALPGLSPGTNIVDAYCFLVNGVDTYNGWELGNSGVSGAGMGWYNSIPLGMNNRIQAAGIKAGFLMGFQCSGVGDCDVIDANPTYRGGTAAYSDEGTTYQLKLLEDIQTSGTIQTGGGGTGATTLAVNKNQNTDGIGQLIIDTTDDVISTTITAASSSGQYSVVTTAATIPVSVACSTVISNVPVATQPEGTFSLQTINLNTTVDLTSAASSHLLLTVLLPYIETNKLVSAGTFTGTTQTVTAMLNKSIAAGSQYCVGGMSGRGMEQVPFTISSQKYVMRVIGSPTNHTIWVSYMGSSGPTNTYVAYPSFSLPMAINLYHSATIVGGVGTGASLTVTDNDAAWTNGASYISPNFITNTLVYNISEVYYNPYTVDLGFAHAVNGLSVLGQDGFSDKNQSANGNYLSFGGVYTAPIGLHLFGQHGAGIVFEEAPEDLKLSGVLFRGAAISMGIIPGGSSTTEWDIADFRTNDDRFFYTPSTRIWGFQGSGGGTINGSQICTLANIGTTCGVTGTGTVTTSGTPTIGVLPLFTGSTVIGNSLLDYGVTTASKFTVGAGLNINDGTGAGGGFDGTEGTAHTGASGVDALWSDSTSHRLRMNNNNGGAVTVASLSDLATSAAFGVVKVDGTTITASAGIISAVGGGGISGLTANFIPKAGSATTITANSALDDGVTTASTITSTEAVNINLAGGAVTSPSNTMLFAANVSGSTSRIAAISYGGQGFFSAACFGGTRTSPTAVTSGTQCGGVNAFAWDTAALGGPIASFRTFADQTQAVGAHGSYADIATTPDGSTTLTQVLKFENDGGMTTPSVAGGDKGAGTINAAGLYINGVAVGTSAGTVSSFSAGTLSPLFTTSVATATSTPALTFTLSNAAANKFFGNNTGSSGAPAYVSIGTSDWSPNAYITGAGSVNVMTATLSPAATALSAGLRVEVLPNLANTTTTPTLNVNGLGAKTITKNGTVALVANDYTTTAIADFEYDGTEWQLLNPQTSSAGGTPAYPLTITGGVSGGVVYGSSSTQLTVSPSLTAGTAMLWGGAGVAPTSYPIAGVGNGLTTGPTSVTTGDLACFTGTAGQIADGGPSNCKGLGVVLTGTASAKAYATATNCASAASPAVCSSASAGAVVIAAGATAVTVDTTAVTANSEIEITPDSSLGTRLGVTCNTTLASIIGPVVTARTAGASFTVTITGTLVTNPACYTYTITN